MTVDRRKDLIALLNAIDVDEACRRRSVQEAIAGVLPATWHRRAAMFEWARPRPGEYPGGPVEWDTGKRLAPPPNWARKRGEAWRRCSEIAAVCRERAALCEIALDASEGSFDVEVAA